MKFRVSPIGWVVLPVFIAGLALLFFASGEAAELGLIVALLTVCFVIADQLPAGVLGGRGVAASRRLSTSQARPEPEYIERAAAPSEEAWARAQERHRGRDDPQ